MNRFLLLAGDHYYPNKWRDFKGAFSTIEDAHTYLANHTRYDWWQIISLDTLRVVEDGVADE